MDIPSKERDKVLSHPSFPKWMIPPSKHFPSPTYGPGEDVQWVSRAEPTKKEVPDVTREKRGTYGLGWTVARVGLFSKGVVFEQVIGNVEIFPWKHLVMNRTPEQGLYICTWWTPDTTGLCELFDEVDRNQARAILTYPSGRQWNLPPIAWKELGMDTPRQKLPDT
jgi:hypothetical protein